MTLKEEVDRIEWAIGQTNYKYFGDYGFSEDQHKAVNILEEVAGRYVELLKKDKRGLFHVWVSTHNPDSVTRMVFAELHEKYILGDSGPIFGKMLALEGSIFHRLRDLLRSMIDYLGLTGEYLIYKEDNE